MVYKPVGTQSSLEQIVRNPIFKEMIVFNLKSSKGIYWKEVNIVIICYCVIGLVLQM